MNKISIYHLNGVTLYRVKVGDRSESGFSNAEAAFMRGIKLAQELDSRAAEFLPGKSLARQVAIIFGAEIQQQYFGKLEE